jgi:hypothetical protein
MAYGTSFYDCELRHWLAACQVGASWQRWQAARLLAQDEGRDPLWLVDLDVVPGVVQQVQLAVGEQRGLLAAGGFGVRCPDRWLH